MEPRHSQVTIDIGGVKVSPGDVVFADVDGVVIIPKAMVAAVADQADKLGANEAAARDRILGGERLQSVWPADSTYSSQASSGSFGAHADGSGADHEPSAG